MTYNEEALLFDCAGKRLVGILAKPDAPATTGVIVIVGGPQYRAGSHRQFVLLSRALAAAGYAALRFDYRGMGDSEGSPRDFLAVSEDIGTAVALLQDRVTAVKQIVLWGLCDGASAALLYCHETGDKRVVGLCLLNPWVRSEATLAKTQVKHYYTQRLRQKDFWVKLFSGKVAASAVGSLARSVKTALFSQSPNGQTAAGLNYQQKMALAWDHFSGKILLVLSGNDYTAKEFLENAQGDTSWKNALTHPQLLRHDLQDADHTFSSPASGNAVVSLMLRWLEPMSVNG